MDEYERLRMFIRYEMDPFFFDDDSVYESDPFSVSYKVTYDDVVSVCENIIDADPSFEEMEDWVCYIFEVINEHFEWPENSDCLWGTTDEDMIRLIFDSLYDVCYEDLCYEDASTIKEAVELIYEMIRDHEYNRGRDLSEWRISKLHRSILLRAYEGETEKLSPEYKSRFRELVEQACDEKDTVAMHIKGYECYGGGDLYACDWEESRRLITELFDLTGNPQYANTLGYIYYYGRCNGGIPEYDKAFQYYSIGAAHDLLESMYKIADMFKAGKGCIKSPKTSAHIIQKLYMDVRPRFCRGSDANFADIALRFASIFRDNEDYVYAYEHYLEADYAIKKRLLKSDFFGNYKVQENITGSLEEVRAHLPETFFVDEFELENTRLLNDLFDLEKKIRVHVERTGENCYKMELSVEEASDEDKLLVVFPRIDYVELTDKLVFKVTTDSPIAYEEDASGDVIVDSFFRSAQGEYFFCLGDEDVFFMSGVKFIVCKEYL